MEVGKGYASRESCLKRRGVGKTQKDNGRTKSTICFLSKEKPKFAY